MATKAKKGLDLLSIGDAALDVFLRIQEADIICQLHEENCLLCLSYANKIPVERVTKVPGSGNASNNAVGSARLGMKTAIYSILGTDETGDEIVRHWKKEKVAEDWVVRDKHRPTNYSLVLNYRGERTELLYTEKRDYTFPSNAPKASWVYLTAMGQGSERIHPQLNAYLDRTGAKLVFQPGTFQLRLGMRMLKQMIARCAVLFVNKEEAEELLGDGHKNVPTLLSQFHDAGCRMPVITDGQNGSYAYDGKTMLHMPIIDEPVVERTGAGDAFATAFVAALHHGKSMADAMRWGTCNSASVIGAIGPQEGLLTRAKLAGMLRRFPNIKPKKV